MNAVTPWKLKSNWNRRMPALEKLSTKHRIVNLCVLICAVILVLCGSHKAHGNGAAGAFEQLEPVQVLNGDSSLSLFGFVDATRGEQFIVVHIRSSMNCGTRGCATAVYRFSDEDFLVQLSPVLSVNMPVYKKKCRDALFLVFSSGAGHEAGLSEWEYTGSAMEYRRTYQEMTAASKCRD